MMVSANAALEIARLILGLHYTRPSFIVPMTGWGNHHETLL